MGNDAEEITQLLLKAQKGDSASADKLFPFVYASLRQLARRQMAAQRKGHTLQPTALVNEAYVKLFGSRTAAFNGKEHFLRAAAQAMRRILIDHAKAKNRDKRGGGTRAIALEECHLAVDSNHEDLLTIDEAICRLERMDSDAAAVIRMRFYIGLSLEEIAQARDVSLSTIRRECAFARAFLFRELSQEGL